MISTPLHDNNERSFVFSLTRTSRARIVMRVIPKARCCSAAEFDYSHATTAAISCHESVCAPRSSVQKADRRRSIRSRIGEDVGPVGEDSESV